MQDSEDTARSRTEKKNKFGYLTNLPSGYETIDCYEDTSNRAIPTLESADTILDRSYSSQKNPIAKCTVAAMRKGTACLQFRMVAGVQPVLQRHRPLTSMKNLHPAGRMVKVEDGLIRFITFIKC